MMSEGELVLERWGREGERREEREVEKTGSSGGDECRDMGKGGG